MDETTSSLFAVCWQEIATWKDVITLYSGTFPIRVTKHLNDLLNKHEKARLVIGACNLESQFIFKQFVTVKSSSVQKSVAIRSTVKGWLNTDDFTLKKIWLLFTLIGERLIAVRAELTLNTCLYVEFLHFLLGATVLVPPADCRCGRDPVVVSRRTVTVQVPAAPVDYKEHALFTCKRARFKGGIEHAIEFWFGKFAVSHLSLGLLWGYGGTAVSTVALPTGGSGLQSPLSLLVLPVFVRASPLVLQSKEM